MRIFPKLFRIEILFVLISVGIGLAAGVGIYTFIYAKGASYLSNNPKVCANCHVMNDEFSGWVKSTHHAVATCNDCHLPHDSLIAKYKTKGSNGFWHSFYFTTGGFKDNIRIKNKNREVLEANCRHCHQDIVFAMDGPHPDKAKLSCVRCHVAVGHP